MIVRSRRVRIARRAERVEVLGDGKGGRIARSVTALRSLDGLGELASSSS